MSLNLANYSTVFAEQVKTLVLVGGIARSGTTKLASILHAIEQVFCFAECHPLKELVHQRCFATSPKYLENERSAWMDDFGRSYRGFTQKDVSERSRFLFFSLLAAHTPDSYLDNKDIKDVTIGVCKTPSLEFTFPDIVSAPLNIEHRYIHCVRSPWACISSNWEMPWTPHMRAEDYIESFAALLEASRLAYLRIRSLKYSSLVIRIEDIVDLHAHTRRQLESFLQVTSVDMSRNQSVVDDWPKIRRIANRSPLPIELKSALLADERTVDWCKEFGYSNPLVSCPTE